MAREKLASDLSVMYSKPLPASRSGALYSAFSYPTKISPESIAVFIASHTSPGDTVVDTFGGSGTTGLAAHLCSSPTEEVIELAKQLEAPVVWGPRKAVIYELSVLGAFVARTMSNPPDANHFLRAVEELIAACEQKAGFAYSAADDRGNKGFVRYNIWSDILQCSDCEHQVSFWDAAVSFDPIAISSEFVCPACGKKEGLDEAERVLEQVLDPLTGEPMTRRKRVLKRVYGQTGKRKWFRPALPEDELLADKVASTPLPPNIPLVEMNWGDLYRSGYHKGITHAHHFYTPRNLLVMATLWEQIEAAPEELQDALKLLVLSYNASHATLMTRVVVKSGQTDFVLTGAQPGVLYISSLPVEKNMFEGMRRKAKTIAKAFGVIQDSTSHVTVVQGSSTKLDLPDQSVDYVFTDPPFGDYIPYAEINFLNEVWLGKTTDNSEEIVVSPSQKKTVSIYGELMADVFREISRTLKDEGKATLVFHSARADVWKALQEAYQQAGLRVEQSSVLDKIQGSFKQVTSTISVKGDPLLYLSKDTATKQGGTGSSVLLQPDQVIQELIDQAALSPDTKEQTKERLYSRFVAMYLEQGVAVPLDASRFYERLKQLTEG
ncbi:DNA methyltransferase [Brevibacillus sp. SYSU BS000544]|uniref:DNA methyltransferase n=1 Tax=Brevibacillus sp. SYSU BS000544 TaxID=3416443 RepID=UPI003CE566DF